MSLISAIPRNGPRLGNALVCVAGAVAILSCLTVLVMLLLKTIPSQALNVFGVEQNVIFAIQRVLLYGTAYSDPASMPFTTIQYPPFYGQVVATLCRMLGIPADAPHDIVLVGRVVSAGFSAIAGVIVGRHLVRHHQVPAILAIITALLVIIGQYPSGFCVRPDSAYLSLLLAAAACCANATTRPMRWLAAAQILLIAALFTKQTAIAFVWLPAAVALLVGDDSFGVRLRRSVATAGLGLVTVAVLLAANPWLVANSVVGLSNGRSLTEAVDKTWLPFAADWGMLVALTAGCAVQAVITRDRRLYPLAAMAALTFGVATTLSLKVGARANYYNEFLAMGLMLATATAVALWRQLHWRAAPVAVGLGLMAIALPWIVFVDQRVAVLRAVSAVAAPPAYRELLDKALAEDPGRVVVFDLNAPVYYPRQIALATMDVVALSYAAGVFPLAPVTKAIGEQRLRWLIVPADLATADGMPAKTPPLDEHRQMRDLAVALLPSFAAHSSVAGWHLLRAAAPRP